MKNISYISYKAMSGKILVMALMCAAVLAGCNNSKPAGDTAAAESTRAASQITESTQSTQSSQSTRPSQTAQEADSSAADTSQPREIPDTENTATRDGVYFESDSVVYAYPDSSDRYVGSEYNALVDLDALRDALGMDINEVRERLAEAGEFTETTGLTHLNAQSISFKLAYVGNSEADWLCLAVYDAKDDEGRPHPAGRICYVRDSKPVRDVAVFDLPDDIRLCGDDILVLANNNFYMVNGTTGDLWQVNNNLFSWGGRFIAESEKYLAIETDRVMIYDKIKRTFINKNIMVKNHTCSFDGNSILYTVLEDGTIFEECYDENEVFEGYKLIVSAGCTEEDIGSLINEYKTVTIELDEGNDFFTLGEDGCLYSRDMTVLYAAPYDAENVHFWIVPKTADDEKKEFNVPETVTRIAVNAFYCLGEGRPLSFINVYDGVEKENVRQLKLWEGTKVYRIKGLDEEQMQTLKEEAIRVAAQFNADERELSRLYRSASGMVGRALISEGKKLSYSVVSAEKYTDPHFYVYADGQPEYVIAILIGENMGEKTYTSADGALEYSLVPLKLDEGSRYIEEALEMKKEGVQEDSDIQQGEEQ